MGLNAFWGSLSGVRKEFIGNVAMDKLGGNAATIARSIASGDNIAGKASRWGARQGQGMLGNAFGGAFAAGYGPSRIMSMRSMATAAAINGGVGAGLGFATDSDDRMGGAMRGGLLGIGGGLGARMGYAGAMKYAGGNPQFRAMGNTMRGRVTGFRSNLQRMGG